MLMKFTKIRFQNPLQRGRRGKERQRKRRKSVIYRYCFSLLAKINSL